MSYAGFPWRVIGLRATTKVLALPMARYNTRLIKTKASYSPSEIAKLYGKNRQICFRWIKNEGLKVMEKNTNPLLIMGSDLKDFLDKKNAKWKITLAKNECYCVKCRKAVKPKAGSEQIVKTGKRAGKDNQEQFKKTGLCEFCGTEVNKLLSVYQKD